MKRLCVAMLTFVCLLGADKRPLNHADYDSWRQIFSPTLSRDGHSVAYALFPQEGNGELVARDLQTGKEWRAPIGQQPPPAKADPNSEEPPRQRSVTVAFTNGGKTLVFTTFPSREEVEKARTEKKPAPKGGLTIMDLPTGSMQHLDAVKSFAAPEKSGPMMVYLKEPADKAKAGDLVVRSFANGAEKTLGQATDYTLAKSGDRLVFATEAGVQFYDGTASRPLAEGKAKYSKLAWNEDQSRLAFAAALTDRNPARIYVWTGGAEKAVVVADESSTGLKAGYHPSDSGTLQFSRNGEALFFGVSQKQSAAATPATPLDPERASFDLWHYQDDNIQPMQKVRAAQDRTRSYRAVWHSGTGKVLQLADAEMAEATPNEDGTWALGGDDRAYRPMVEFAERYSDAYVVNAVSGERKLITKKHSGRLTWSPDGKYLLRFDGKDWIVASVPDGREVNITQNVATKFWNEEQDTPSTRAPYGSAGWTKDGRSVLLYDRFDIWAVSPDGSGAANVTNGEGRKQGTEFRYVRRDPEEKAIDTAKPILLRAENIETRDTGFYTWTPNSAPKKLVAGPREYRLLATAKEGDAVLFTAGTFHDYPELEVSDTKFAKISQVSHANPQMDSLNWGSGEMVRFRNSDGVPLEGALYKPDNFDPKKKYPMLVYIYERLSQNLNTFVHPKPGHSINIAYYVSNGYLVFTPDIVYKTGYPGPSALKCVLPGMQAVVDKGYVDEKRIGIAGHSWGGYQIAYMITQTDRFRAVEAGAPVANMTSAYDGVRWGSGLPRQFQYEKTQSRIGGSLWENPIQYVENSPIFHADRVHTPLLMLHNDADDAVPWYQGIEYYLALRRLQKEVYLFVYHGEPHHLDRRPNQKDYTVRMQQFFDYYLKDAPKPEWMTKGIPFLETPEGRQAPKAAGATSESGDPDQDVQP